MRGLVSWLLAVVVVVVAVGAVMLVTPAAKACGEAPVAAAFYGSQLSVGVDDYCAAPQALGIGYSRAVFADPFLNVGYARGVGLRAPFVDVNVGRRGHRNTAVFRDSRGRLRAVRY